MLVVAEYDELPYQSRQRRLMAGFVGINYFDVADDLLEIAAHAIFSIAFRRGAVDGAGYQAYLVFHQALQNFIADVIKIGAIPDRNRDIFLVSIFKNLQQLRIEKDLAVI